MYQREIVKCLDSLANVTVCIKPVLNYSDNKCSTIEIFKKLKNVQILQGLTFIQCLNKFAIKAVVMEFPSTPLFEVIGKDVDIFLLADPILPFSSDALYLLKKRVYFFEDLHELKSSLMQYLVGDLPILRNNEFYNKYGTRSQAKNHLKFKI